MKRKFVFISVVVAISMTSLFQIQAQNLKDADGNVYKTKVYGSQEWTIENYKCTKYNDGTPIIFGKDKETWLTANSEEKGAYGVMRDLPFESYKANCGLLYNWHAVNTGKLAPAGWRVPSEADITALNKYLIAQGFNCDDSKKGSSGGKLGKAMVDMTNTTVPWKPSDKEGAVANPASYPDKANVSGFSAIPIGRLSESFSGGSFGTGFFMWTTALDKEDAEKARNANILGSGDGFNGNSWPKGYGASIRLVRDVKQ